jgi:ABC-type phosphate transport system substrate-binding protein
MKKNKRTALTFAALAIPVMATAICICMCIWTIVSAFPVQAAGDSIVVIVNGSNPVDNLSMGELRKLFLSDRTRWDTGRDVAPVMLTAGAPERTLFLKIVFGMNDADFDRYFLRVSFTGKSVTPPKVVGSVRDVRRIVGNSPGAIGFVRSSDFHDASNSVIKMVKIDGFAATDAAYKIHM